MKYLLALTLTLFTSFIYAQTECIEIALFPEQLDTLEEKVLVTPATYGYRIIGGSSAEFKEVEEVLIPSYTHVFLNQNGEKCKEVKPAVIFKYMKVVIPEVLPTVEKYVVSEAVYKTVYKVIVLKDGAIKTFNKNCSE